MPRKKDAPISNEVRLRQLTVDEALFKLDKYLNSAFMAGLSQVKVIHGREPASYGGQPEPTLTSTPW